MRLDADSGPMRARFDWTRIERIVVLRALQLGDLLCAVPAWRALRRHAPHAQVTLIGLPWARDFAARFARYVDDVIEFPGFPGLPEREPDLAAVPAFLLDAQRRRFDLALQMHGNGTVSNQVIALLGARHCAGFAAPGAYRPASTFWNYPEGEPEIRRHLRLMSHLGVEPCGEELEFPILPGDYDAFIRLKDAEPQLHEPYVCIHPGGRGLNRRWPTEEFARVADALADDGLTVVLTGTSAEAELSRLVRRAMRAPAVDAVGRTDLGALGLLLGRARLLVANDTGVSHMACALRVPSVIVSVGSDPIRWGPLDQRRHRLLPGDAVTAADVVRAARELLARERIGAVPTGAAS